MKRARVGWLIENNTGPRPVYFTMRMEQGCPVATLNPEHAPMTRSEERAIAYIEEFQLGKGWKAVECTLGNPR
jgi:hypothetical protein